MSLRILFLALVAISAAAPLHAIESNSALFERVDPTAYTDMLRDAGTAYEAKRYDESFGLFQRTACAGDKQSQSALGRMYLLGQGVERDDLTGYAWLKLASEIIYPGYQSVVRKLEQAMTPEQRQIGQAKASALSGLYSLAASGMSCAQHASKGGHIIDQIVCTPQSEGKRLLLRRCDVTSPD